MNILFAAPEEAWSGMYRALKDRHPEHEFAASGKFAIESLAGYDVLIPTMSSVTEEILVSADRLRLIQQVGSGLEMVDLEAAARRGICVANVPTGPSGNADSVAELGIYLMIGLARDVRGMAASFRDRRIGAPVGKALVGSTVGLVGLGGLGRALAARLKPFGVRLLGVKRSSPESARIALGLDWAGTLRDLPVLLSKADFTVLALPVTPETQGLMNDRTFGMMKPGSFLINLGRGGLVERDSLEKALSENRIAGAGLDVFWEEPPDPKDPIFQHNILATPHIAGATDLSGRGIREVVSENIDRLSRGDELKYCVTP